MMKRQGRGADLRRAAEAAQMVLAKHPTVIPSADPPKVRKTAPRADAAPTDVGVRNIARALAK